jgi:DNA polymerase III epsilon subunit-like protein
VLTPHRATYDALVTARLFVHLATLPNIGSLSLEVLRNPPTHGRFKITCHVQPGEAQDSDGHMDPCRCLVATLDDDMDACRTCAGVWINWTVDLGTPRAAIFDHHLDRAVSPVPRP